MLPLSFFSLCPWEAVAGYEEAAGSPGEHHKVVIMIMLMVVVIMIIPMVVVIMIMLMVLIR